MSGLLGGGAPVDVPASPAQKRTVAKTTAQPVNQLSEQAKKNRRRSASLLTRPFGPPKLGQGGVLG